jgi:hypothetical protein
VQGTKATHVGFEHGGEGWGDVVGVDEAGVSGVGVAGLLITSGDGSLAFVSTCKAEVDSASGDATIGASVAAATACGSEGET